MALFASNFVVIAIFFKVILFSKVTFGVQYRVGGLQGWDYGIDYQAWSSSIIFKQGDTLYFDYLANMHSVLEVSEQDYKTCNTRAPIRSDGGRGQHLVKLEAGTFYFICGLPSHCLEGHMKLVVPVQASPSAIPSATPSTSSSSSPPSLSHSSTYKNSFSTFIFALLSSFTILDILQA